MAGIQDVWLRAHHMLRSARQCINEGLHPMNLSSAEGNILLHLLTQGQEIGQEQLVAQLDINKAAVSRALDSLEVKGFVTRRADPNDRRAHRVRLTGQARDIGPAIEQVYNRVYTLAMEGISQEEMDTFTRLFNRISDNFTCRQVNKVEEKGNG